MNQTSNTIPESSRPKGRALLSLLICLCVVAAGGMMLYIPKEDVRLRYDSMGYTGQSINIYEGLGNTIDIGGEPVPGYYPAGYPIVTAAAHMLLGLDLKNGIRVNFAFALLLLVLVFFLGNRIAGPGAGVLAMLLMLSSETFRLLSRMIVSQPTSLVLMALAACFFYTGWKAGPKGWWLRLGVGLLCGMLVLVRSAEVMIAPAVATAAFLAPPISGRSRWSTAFPVWCGVALAVMLVFLHNTVYYGAPLNNGYKVWGLVMNEAFTLSNIFNPTIFQGDENPWPLVRSLFGFGMLYKWPIALATILGGFFAWRNRGLYPGLWRLFLMILTLTVFLYGFLALYFYRSPFYILLTTPLIVTFAAGALMLMANHLQRRKAFRLPWLHALLLVGAAAQLVPCLDESHLFGKGPERKPQMVDQLEKFDDRIEENAVVLSGMNPAAVDYVLIRHTERKHLFICFREDIPMKEMYMRLLGEEAVTPENAEKYVRKHLEAGIPVYCLLGVPDETENYPLMRDVFTHLRRVFKVLPTADRDLKRFVLKE